MEGEFTPPARLKGGCSQVLSGRGVGRRSAAALEGADVAQMAVKEGDLHAVRAACSRLCGRGGLWQHDCISTVELRLPCCQAGRSLCNTLWKEISSCC